MHKTKNDLAEGTRTKIVTLLNATLADAIDLMLRSKQAHWNVKGPSFIALHELFDKIHTDAAEYVDLIAERAVTLGGVAEGTLGHVVKRTTLGEYPAAATDQKDHIEALSSSLASFGKVARRAIDEAAELRDADTADLYTEISRGVDKWLWFVEAHAQGK
jgi:starvation-inducible DNA-binding protein